MPILINKKLATRKENHRGDFVRFAQDGSAYLEIDGNPEDEWVLVWPLKPTDIAGPYTYDKPREPPRVQRVDWVRLNPKFAELDNIRKTRSETVRPPKSIQSISPTPKKAVDKHVPSDEEERSLSEKTSAELSLMQVKLERMKAKQKTTNKFPTNNTMETGVAHLHQATHAKAPGSRKLGLSSLPSPPVLPPDATEVFREWRRRFQEELIALVLSEGSAASSR
jgi:hypothetical protein